MPETMRCICGFTDDDGFAVACDDCSRWVHAACFDITDTAHVPDEWRCWVCRPREVDRARAVRTQRVRMRASERVYGQGDAALVARSAPVIEGDGNLRGGRTLRSARGERRRVSAHTSSGGEGSGAGPSSRSRSTRNGGIDGRRKRRARLGRGEVQDENDPGASPVFSLCRIMQ